MRQVQAWDDHTQEARAACPRFTTLQANQGSRARHSGGGLVLVALEESQKQRGNVQHLALWLQGRAAATLRSPVLGGTKELHTDILGTLFLSHSFFVSLFLPGCLRNSVQCDILEWQLSIELGEQAGCERADHTEQMLSLIPTEHSQRQSQCG